MDFKSPRVRLLAGTFARNLYSIAQLLTGEKYNSEAQVLWVESCKIFQGLYTNDPRGYRPDFARSSHYNGIYLCRAARTTGHPAKNWVGTTVPISSAPKRRDSLLHWLLWLVKPSSRGLPANFWEVQQSGTEWSRRLICCGFSPVPYQ